MSYNFIKLSDAPVAEDGATHVLGTKDGQVVRVPASGLGAVALDLEIAGWDNAEPLSTLDASTREANSLAGATLRLATGEAYTADDAGRFVAEELYTALSDYIRRGCVLLLRALSGGELAGTSLVLSTAYHAWGGVHVLGLWTDGPELIIFDRDPGER